MNALDLLRRRRHPTIFICYRRHGEGSGYGGRLADKLVQYFGPHQCFRDVENIETGTDFVEAIQRAIDVCTLLVVVIGPDWATREDATHRPRIEDPQDFVRLEVATALKRNMRVMPVLVGGAQLPEVGDLPDDLAALARRQAHELTDSRWDFDTDRLIESIESIGIKGNSPNQQHAFRQKLKGGAAALIGIAVALLWVALPEGFDGGIAEAELAAEKAKRIEAERARAVTRPPPDPIPNIEGIWRDRDAPSNGGRINQNGSRFDFSRWGVLPNGVRFESVGTGAITARRFTSRYDSTYSIGRSTGNCEGSISSGGSRLDMTCTDSALGVFQVTSFRERD